ncbi:hypothetical protein [Zunongwangia endophytica]|uniref:Outer membrane protein beta-barrel domain-containing protein n=1 Tax=Zunongwangia endophytica TaxID=1808945 RepID=A0ABV8H3G5_9FLAO|nr:hypothetical protein [Zunongwangia endophytica]MDN3595870.1 hypothetical protein [Zunongwangia endophytica]
MKKLLFIFGIFSYTFLLAQQSDVEVVAHRNWYQPEDPETIYFELSTFYPLGMSDSSFGNDYQLDQGIQFGVHVFIVPEFTIGLYGKWHGSEVTNIEKIGNISETRFNEYGLELGYYYAIDRQMNVQLTGAIGSVNLRNLVDFSSNSFWENGISYKLGVAFGYRFNQTLAIFAKVSPYFLKLDIKNEAYDDYLNDHILMDFGVGLRIHLHNPNG